MLITDLRGRNHQVTDSDLVEALTNLMNRFDELATREPKLIIENLDLKQQRLTLQQQLRRKDQELAQIQALVDASISNLDSDWE